MKITSKQRRVSNVRQAKHLVWTSETHKHDRKQADKIRLSVPVEQAWYRQDVKGADKIACQVLFEDGQGKRVDGERFEKEVAKQARKRSWYMSSGRKRRVKGIIDTYCGLPPWWGRVLNEELESGRMTEEQVQGVALRLAKACMDTLQKRTGYQPVYISVHPESVNNIHLHFGVANITLNNELCGRSANGKVGKKGLRHAGDCNLALLRMNQALPHANTRAGARKALQGDYDDVAMASVIDHGLEQLLPDLSKRAKEYAIEHASKWVKKAEEKKTFDPKSLRQENERLKKENIELKQEVQSLRSKLLDPDMLF
jgi:hypothetical protein